MGPGAPQKLGPPVLLQTLALYSYMTSENAKVTKIGKGIFFKMKSAILLCHQTANNTKHEMCCIYISEEVNNVLNTS